MKIRIAGLFMSLILLQISCTSKGPKVSEKQRLKEYPVYLKVNKIAENPESSLVFAVECLGIIELDSSKMIINIAELWKSDPNLTFPKSSIWTIDFIGDFDYNHFKDKGSDYMNGSFQHDGKAIEVSVRFYKEESETALLIDSNIIQIGVEQNYNQDKLIWFCQKLSTVEEVKALYDEINVIKNRTPSPDIPLRK